MPDSEFLCARCARHTKTCCQSARLYATRGDVERIATVHTAKATFSSSALRLIPAYLDQDDDPLWRDRVFHPDGTRRVLKRQPDGDCTFLGAHG